MGERGSGVAYRIPRRCRGTNWKPHGTGPGAGQRKRLRMTASPGGVPSPSACRSLPRRSCRSIPRVEQIGRRSVVFHWRAAPQAEAETFTRSTKENGNNSCATWGKERAGTAPSAPSGWRVPFNRSGCHHTAQSCRLLPRVTAAGSSAITTAHLPACQACSPRSKTSPWS